MPQLTSQTQIKLLSTELANQIAAGEVIERPASVLKELIENALDANSTRIDIDLQNGGIDAVVVADDGLGIRANELGLALSRHATSKIDSSDDLLNLNSLGFRGEALASISSVSQWELISRKHDQSSAAKLSFDYPDKIVEANHAPGTRVSIRKLFYNTPARKKFLKAERTELRHCDEVIKRLALANFMVGFYVRHNERQTLRLPAVKDDVGRTRRVSQICGESFIKQSISLDFPYNGMRLWGWISRPSFSRQSADLQYFYINGRIIRDRVINHAIRSVYQSILPPGRHAAYVLHLDMSPSDVDVNVHPTKHEVRFRESRLIHDFISRSIRNGLQQLGVQTESYSPSVATYQQQGIVKEVCSVYTTPEYSEVNSRNFGQLRDIYFSRFAVSGEGTFLFLIDLQLVVAHWVVEQWHEALKSNTLQSLPLLIPESFDLDEQTVKNFLAIKERFNQIGFEITGPEAGKLLIRKIPAYLRCYDVTSLIKKILESEQPMIEEVSLFECMQSILLQFSPDLSKLSLNSLIQAMSDNPESYQSAWRTIDEADLSGLFHDLK